MAKVTNTSTMAVNKNMIIPEVYAELVREKIAGKCKVAQFCVVKGDLQGKPGETLKLPAYKYIGDAKDRYSIFFILHDDFISRGR